jgi:hypothetical protein
MFESGDAGAARIWRQGALELMKQSGEYADEAAEWADNARKWKAHAKNLEAENVNLKLALAVEKAHAEGLSAQKDAFAAAHPQSPMLADTGKRYKASGNIKTKGRLIYEATFDRICREAGIADPTKHRAD